MTDFPIRLSDVRRVSDSLEQIFEHVAREIPEGDKSSLIEAARALKAASNYIEREFESCGNDLQLHPYMEKGASRELLVIIRKAREALNVQEPESIEGFGDL